MAGSTGNRPTRDEVLEKQRKGLVLRQAGASWREVAKQIGYSDPSNARKAVIAALEAKVADTVDEMRVMEGSRLDRLQRAVWATALAGDLDAVDRVLRIMAQRARLFGLNAPTKIEVTDEMDREIQMLAASLVDDSTWNITGIPEDTEDQALLAAGEEHDDGA